MTYDARKLETLISSDDLKGALEILQQHLIKSKKFNKKDMEYLDQIITLALAKNDMTLAIKAAVNRGQFGVSWHTIISRANQEGSFDNLDFPTRLLVPKKHSYTPWVLNNLAVNLWTHLQQNRWTIPGVDVLFDANASRPTADKPALLLRKVVGIRGTDFFIGFSGIQGRTKEDWSLNDTAGFSFIAVSNFCMKFFEDHSGPAIYKYNGDDWQGQISKINSPYFSGSSEAGWESVECKIPSIMEVCIDYLFFSRYGIEAGRSDELTTLEQFVEVAAKALEAALAPILEPLDQVEPKI